MSVTGPSSRYAHASLDVADGLAHGVGIERVAGDFPWRTAHDLVRRELRKNIDAENAVLNDPSATAAQKKKASERLDEHLKVIQRSVANYGMINVRTDGERVVTAQRLERSRTKGKRWDIHKFETDERGRLHLVRGRGH